MSKLNVNELKIEQLLKEAQVTGLFQPAGRELKALINRQLNIAEIQILVDWLEKVAREIEKHELR